MDFFYYGLEWFLSLPSACRTSEASKNQVFCCCFVIQKILVWFLLYGYFCMFLVLSVTLCIPTVGTYMIFYRIFDEFFDNFFDDFFDKSFDEKFL